MKTKKTFAELEPSSSKRGIRVSQNLKKARPTWAKRCGFGTTAQELISFGEQQHTSNKQTAKGLATRTLVRGMVG